MSQSVFAIFGPPGSGKGTQVERLAEFNVVGLAPGNILRDEVEKQSALGQRVAPILNAGALVDDATIVEAVKAYTARTDDGAILALDGVPRTLAQAVLLNAANIEPQFVVVLDVNEEEIVRRLSGRLVHPASGRVYNTAFSPPAKEGVDDVTGEPLVRRPDDEPDVIRQRIARYHEQAEKILSFYSASGIPIITISGEESIDDVSQYIKREIQETASRKRRVYRRATADRADRFSSLVLSAKYERDQYLGSDYTKARTKVRRAMTQSALEGGRDRDSVTSAIAHLSVVEDQLKALQKVCEHLATSYAKARATSTRKSGNLEKDLQAALAAYKKEWLRANRASYVQVTTSKSIDPREEKRNERERFKRRFTKLKADLDKREVEAVQEAHRKAVMENLPTNVERLRKRYS